MLVLYYLQGELGESLNTPNAFSIPSSNQVSFGELLQYFPIPYDSLHFRFKFEDPLYGYSWMDIIDESQSLPVLGGVITIKILNLSNEAFSKRRLVLKKSVNQSAGHKEQIVHTNTANKPSSKISREQNENFAPTAVPRKDNNPVVSAPQDPPKKPVVAQQAPQAVPVVQEYDFFSDGGQNVARKPPVQSQSHGIVTGIDEGVVAKNTESVVLNREELQTKRAEEIQEKVDAALQAKRERDETLKKEGEDIELAKSTHDARLTAWAFNNKEKRNVRTLLSTMHTVLWAGNKWKPISLGDVIDPQKVKLNYRKAMLVVHPDRCSNETTEIKFIAKRIFEAINEAYDDFLKKEGLS